MTEGLTRYKQPSAAAAAFARGRLRHGPMWASAPTGGNRGAAVQTAFRSRRSLRKRPLAARADVGIGPYRRQQRCSGTNGFPQPPQPSQEAACGTGRCGHRPLQAATEVQRYKRLSAATIPSARGRFAARADECIGPYSAPAANVPTYYVQRENSCKNCCVRCLAVFRGSWSGLSENLCSRNSHPILLARAKPGRGRQYGTGQPGGA